MKRNELEAMTMNDLKAYARERKISCSKQIEGKKHNYTKAELIDVLLGAEEVVDTEEEFEEVEETMSVNENSSLKDLLDARAELDKLICEKKKVHTKKNPRNEEYDENFSMYGGVNPFTFTHTRNKERHIEEAEVGTLIAFLDENGKPRTAALVNRSSKRRLLKLKTEFDWEFEVPYDNVLWVRTKGNRWAYGVYRILKGYNPNGRCGEDTFGQEG